ncbi:MAG TPA: response regulator [Rudaea sp.]|nr:response regulator [Rudaea sp.]
MIHGTLFHPSRGRRSRARTADGVRAERFRTSRGSRHVRAAAFTRLFAANDFDAILLDLELGTERGETLIEQLRIAHCNVPEVIIVSAQPQVELQRAMRRIDACAALGKPCSVRELNAELERCLDERARGDR